MMSSGAPARTNSHPASAATNGAGNPASLQPGDASPQGGAVFGALYLIPITEAVMEEELEFAKGLAQQAGEIMLQHFQIGVLHERKPDEGDTPVTVADTTINKMVIKTVREKYPHYSLIGEEESHMVPD